MVQKVNGSAFAGQWLTGSLEYYTCYASSPLCYSNPNPNPPQSEELTRLLNIQVTESIADESQRNFELLLLSISLRAMPTVMTDPLAVSELAMYTNELTGEGFVWKFACERAFQFHNYTPFGTAGPVGLLIDELDGIILQNGVRITTIANSPSGWAQNITFMWAPTL